MEVRVGAMYGGLGALVFGQGPPLMVFPPFSADNAVPTGRARHALLHPVLPLGERFTVHVVNRYRGLREGTSIEDMADAYAEAIRHDLVPPVPVLGISTGGAIAQQFAIDHPDLVSRLVVFASACRLSWAGRKAQARLGRLVVAGRPRRAWAGVGRLMGSGELSSWLTAASMWAFGRSLGPEDPQDMLVTIAAEDVFDCEQHLPRVTAPTLVVGGAKDRFYPEDLIRRTAAAIPWSELRLYPDKGHADIMMHRPAIEEVRRFLTAS